MSSFHNATNKMARYYISLSFQVVQLQGIHIQINFTTVFKTPKLQFSMNLASHSEKIITKKMPKNSTKTFYPNSVFCQTEKSQKP